MCVYAGILYCINVHKILKEIPGNYARLSLPEGTGGGSNGNGNSKVRTSDQPQSALPPLQRVSEVIR